MHFLPYCLKKPLVMTGKPTNYLVNKVFLIFFLFIPFLSFSSSIDSDARTLISMLDYIDRDYPNAVDSGVVINEFEFREMSEFSAITIDHFKRLTAEVAVEDSAGISMKLIELGKAIAQKSTAKDISNRCREIKKSILALNLVSNAPASWPNIAEGASLYQINCSSCHGEKADGQGPLASSLDPRPSDFYDSVRLGKLSPFQVYNTIRLGIPGTGMMPIESLSEEEIWAVAFYITSLGHPKAMTEISSDEIPVSLLEAATLSDEELMANYGQNELDLTAIRQYRIGQFQGSTIDLAKKYVETSLNEYKKGAIDLAFEFALKAYLEGVEPVENRLAASDAQMVGRLEQSMMGLRNAIKNRMELSEVENLANESVTVLNEAGALLEGQSKGLLFTTFLASSILIREGLEAFLIIISILAILKSLKAEKAMMWVHAGWIAAVLFGAMGWFFIDQLVSWSVASRELMEGSLTLFAAGVLVFMGFWLHSKTEVSKWRKFVEERIVSLIDSNKMFGLTVFSFIVVFREAFESVIFLSSLKVDSPDDSAGIWLGLIIATVIVTFLSWAILKLFARINLRKVFLFSSAIIVVLAVILTGEGVHALQESGTVGVQSLSWNIRMGILGIYPTVQTMVAQAFSIAVIAGLWYYNKRMAN